MNRYVVSNIDDKMINYIEKIITENMPDSQAYAILSEGFHREIYFLYKNGYKYDMTERMMKRI